MASNNNARWIDNADGAPGPLRVAGKFQAGSSQVVKLGEMLELSGGNFIPLDADQAMSAIITVADEEIKVGDLAGYYSMIVPRPGDRFSFPLATADNPALGAALYWSDSETVTTSTGSNILAYVTGYDHYPMQGHASEDITSDKGTTLRNTSNIILSFIQSASYYAALYI